MRLLVSLFYDLLLFGLVKELNGFSVRPSNVGLASVSSAPSHTPTSKLRSRSDVSENIDEKTEDDDGWMAMRNYNNNLIKKALKLPRWVVSKTTKRVEPGTLILVRHGQSVWNANKTFTGWADPDLSQRGYREVEHAARLLLEGGYEIDVVFTSRLKRAIRSTWLLLSEMNQVYLPVFKSWRLNERMYGGLTGLSKFQTAEQLGAQLVQEWRGSLNSRPPALTPSNMYWPGHDRRYRDLTSEQLPLTESLLDCMVRTQPLWDDNILAELKAGKNVLVVAHANTLRGLVKTIDEISDTDIQDVAIPTGIPIVYKFDHSMKSVRPSGDRQTASQIHMKGLFLEKPGLLTEALKQEEKWQKLVPGYNATFSKNDAPLTSLEVSLNKLNAYRELEQYADQFVDPNAVVEDDGSDGNMGKPIQYVNEDEVWAAGMQELAAGGQFDPDAPTFHPETGIPLEKEEEEGAESMPFTNIISSNHPCVKPFPGAVNGFSEARTPVRKDALIVIIRHGKTVRSAFVFTFGQAYNHFQEHNKLKLFTGWEDAPLAKEGVEEAREAGRLLKAHGFEFDVVYTSWLSRAISTAWLVLDELDALWLPIIKSWRLNERMYGRLTGLSKQMVKQRHGEKQFKAWRRGYKTPPPKVSSFSNHYPGNDPRYQKYLTDLRWSLSESIIRSIEKGRPTMHRKLPKAESLKDCMDRTIPFFVDRIVPDAINKNKRVLISSSENAIRGLLMHLCEIPQEKIVELEIPNGLPIIFDINSKCVKLLDDGRGIDPLEKYDFGKAANYLFRPCQNEDGSPDEECDIRFVGEDLKISAEEKATIEAIKTKEPVSANRS